jgi:hypothetical protein
MAALKDWRVAAVLLRGRDEHAGRAEIRPATRGKQGRDPPIQHPWLAAQIGGERRIVKLSGRDAVRRPSGARHEHVVRDADEVERVFAVVADLYQGELVVGLHDRPDSFRQANSPSRPAAPPHPESGAAHLLAAAGYGTSTQLVGGDPRLASPRKDAPADRFRRTVSTSADAATLKPDLAGTRIGPITRRRISTPSTASTSPRSSSAPFRSSTGSLATPGAANCARMGSAAHRRALG